MKLAKPYQDKGITLIETIIVVAILAIIVSLGLFVSFGFYKSHSLNADQNNLASALRKARSLAINNFYQTGHGVFIDANSYTFFQGASYVSRQQQYDQIFNVSPGTRLSGLQEIVFQQLSGDVNASGTIILTNEELNRAISINNEGRIY